jgi:pyruvate kinase
MARRTKVVATLGPASNDPDTLAAMMRAGMDVARISLAHTRLDDALAQHDLVRRVADGEGKLVATMVDLPGPLVRIGRPRVERVELIAGQEIELRSGNSDTRDGLVFVDHPQLVEVCRVGDRLHLGEAAVVEVTAVGDDHLRADVVFPGPLTGRGAVKLPRTSAALPAHTDRVRDEVRRFVDAGVDIVVASARRRDDLDQLGLRDPGGPLLFAKVESMVAFRNLHELIAAANGIVIGRGGLGLEARLEDLPHLQKHITEECIASALPVITASQMLDSMITAPTPTRAEATDVSNAILDGASAVMLSAETAIGRDPALVVETMARIAERTDETFDHVGWMERIAELRTADRGADDDTVITDAMTIGAARSAEDAGLTTIVCLTTGGFTARSMARFRPKAQILGVSQHERTVRQLACSWGVAPVLYDPPSTDFVPRIDHAIDRAKELGLVHAGELVGVVTGVSATRGATDSFRILRVP